jgi:predicted DNA-binding helix-hairpin-helix protein
MTSSEKLNALLLLGRWDAIDSEQVEINHDMRLMSNNKRELTNKMWTLGEGTERDRCGPTDSSKRVLGQAVKLMANSEIFHAAMPRGSCALLKTLYTNVCNSDCAYCINSAHSREEYSYTPEELARVFHQLYLRNRVQGLFLSSGMGRDPEATMEEMLQSIEILRWKHGFRGYVHMKILPGASRYHIERAIQLANRVSLNVEEPSSSRLGEVTTVKDYGVDILRRQEWIRELARDLPSGQTTQFIVGATGESDREIISRMSQLYDDMWMRRIHYSAFEPIPETRLQSRGTTPGWREHRLYQVDWLYRVYRYSVEEIREALIDDFLPNRDPKVTLARLLHKGPIEVNDASREELLRIPGIGPLSADRILSIRRSGVRIRKRKQLADIGVVLWRAQPFLKIEGNYQATLKDWF